MMKESDSFGRGVASYKEGDYDQAYQQFTQATASAVDPVQEGQARIKLASSFEKSGGFSNYIKAIAIYKEIALNPSYTNITRAYATQALASLFYAYADPKITDEIFSTEPFASMRVSDDVALSYRHLFEYAASLYPLGTAQLRIADWYANAIANRTASAEEISQYKAIIRANIDAAHKDTQRIQYDENEKANIFSILQREAVISARLAVAGDMSFGNWEDLFRQAVNYAQISGVKGSDGYARVNYAKFMAKIGGSARANDIMSILAPINANSSVYANTPFERFLKNEANDVLSYKSDLVMISNFDPEFKDHLIKLGWSETDFAS